MDIITLGNARPTHTLRDVAPVCVLIFFWPSVICTACALHHKCGLMHAPHTVATMGTWHTMCSVHWKSVPNKFVCNFKCLNDFSDRAPEYDVLNVYVEYLIFTQYEFVLLARRKWNHSICCCFFPNIHTENVADKLQNKRSKLFWSNRNSSKASEINKFMH